MLGVWLGECLTGRTPSTVQYCHNIVTCGALFCRSVAGGVQDWKESNVDTSFIATHEEELSVVCPRPSLGGAPPLLPGFLPLHSLHPSAYGGISWLDLQCTVGTLRSWAFSCAACIYCPSSYWPPFFVALARSLILQALYSGGEVLWLWSCYSCSPETSLPCPFPRPFSAAPDAQGAAQCP